MSNIPTIIYLYPLNTQLVTIQGLQDMVSGEYLTTATVTATLVDDRGNPDPVFQNIPLSYTGPNGNYQGTVPDTFNASLGSGYILKIQAQQSGVQALWSIPAQVRPRFNV